MKLQLKIKRMKKRKRSKLLQSKKEDFFKPNIEIFESFPRFPLVVKREALTYDYPPNVNPPKSR